MSTTQTLQLSNETNAYVFYTKPISSTDKKAVVGDLLLQIKKNPFFNLGEYINEDKLKNDLERKIYGTTDASKLTDITPHIQTITEIIEPILQKSFNTVPVEGIMSIYILPMCNQEASEDLDGVNGFTVEGKSMYLLVDVTNPKWEKSLRETVPHEYAHLAYTSTYTWNSILDGIINEGLAEHLRIETVGGEIAPWSNAIEREEALEELKTIPEDILNLFIDESNVDFYVSYFFGTEKLPNWYGYSLGYWFIDEIIQKKKATLLELFKKSPKEILKLL